MPWIIFRWYCADRSFSLKRVFWRKNQNPNELVGKYFILFCVTFQNEERTFSYYRHFGKKSEIFQYFSCQIKFDIFICWFFFQKFSPRIFDVMLYWLFDLSGNELYNQLHLCDHVILNSAGIGAIWLYDFFRPEPRCSADLHAEFSAHTSASLALPFHFPSPHHYHYTTIPLNSLFSALLNVFLFENCPVQIAADAKK